MMVHRLYGVLVILGIGLLLSNVAAWRMQRVLAWQLPAALISKPVYVEGWVRTLPLVGRHATRFMFDVRRLNRQPMRVPVRLAWYQSNANIELDQFCRGMVKLKPVHALRNPQDHWMSSLHRLYRYRAQGYVYRNRWHCQSISPSIRRYVVENINHTIGDSTLSALIIALMIGDQSAMTSQQWQILRQTGTNHLLAVSGLHLGLVAWMAYLCLNVLWRAWPTACLYIPAPRLAAWFALLAMLAYAALCGFGVPVKRALIMNGCFLLAALSARYWPVSWRWWLALVVVLILQPWDGLSTGFYLSFYVVAWLIVIYPRCRHLSAWRQMIVMQACICIVVIPVGLYFFQGVALTSFAANIVAIPCVSFVILPVLIIALILICMHASVAALLLKVGVIILSWLWQCLLFLSNLPGLYWHLSPAGFLPCLLMLLGLLGLSVAAWGWYRILMLPLITAPIFIKPIVPPLGQFWGCMLDVGQGLAMVLRTTHHVMVYDVGAHYYGGFDAGMHVVLPYLRSLRVTKVDAVVVSHADNDHKGGLASLERNISIGRLLMNAPNSHGLGCYAGQHWQWDGVSFDVLYPSKRMRYSGNDSSCVIRVSAKGAHLLLTGDIEQTAEEWLLRHARSQLPATILQVPHHGSLTSSSMVWLQAVKPQLALVSAGFQNRYRLPSSQVLHRYQRLGIQVFNTANLGAITFHSQG